MTPAEHTVTTGTGGGAAAAGAANGNGGRWGGGARARAARERSRGRRPATAAGEESVLARGTRRTLRGSSDGFVPLERRARSRGTLSSSCSGFVPLARAGAVERNVVDPAAPPRPPPHLPPLTFAGRQQPRLPGELAAFTDITARSRRSRGTSVQLCRLYRYRRAQEAEDEVVPPMPAELNASARAPQPGP